MPAHGTASQPRNHATGPTRRRKNYRGLGAALHSRPLRSALNVQSIARVFSAKAKEQALKNLVVGGGGTFARTKLEEHLAKTPTAPLLIDDERTATALGVDDDDDMVHWDEGSEEEDDIEASGRDASVAAHGDSPRFPEREPDSTERLPGGRRRSDVKNRARNNSAVNTIRPGHIRRVTLAIESIAGGGSRDNALDSSSPQTSGAKDVEPLSRGRTFTLARQLSSMLNVQNRPPPSLPNFSTDDTAGEEGEASAALNYAAV